MKQNSSKYLFAGICLGILILGAPIAFYILNFQDYPISKDPEHWGQFADYLNVFVSLANLLVIGMLTYAIHRNEQQREQEKEQLQEEAEKNRKLYEQQTERPIVVFQRESHYSEIWQIINVERGPALYIQVYFDKRYETFAHLMPGKAEPLYQKIDNEEWQTSYKDIFDNRYISRLVNDETKVEQVKPQSEDR